MVKAWCTFPLPASPLPQLRGCRTSLSCSRSRPSWLILGVRAPCSAAQQSSYRITGPYNWPSCTADSSCRMAPSSRSYERQVAIYNPPSTLLRDGNAPIKATIPHPPIVTLLLPCRTCVSLTRHLQPARAGPVRTGLMRGTFQANLLGKLSTVLLGTGLPNL